MRAGLVVFLMAAIAGCSQAPAQQPSAPHIDSGAIVTQIRAIETQWQADWNSRDSTRIASHYADDAVFMAPGIPVLRGRPAIQAAFADMPHSDPDFALSFHAEEVQVSASGDMAYARGLYEEHDTNPRTHAVTASSGSYVTIYRKQSDGAWLAVADINTPEPNASAPSGPAQPH
jgi:uncharacterized protein (TIGR02246 family)